ncbi:MAG: O-antigen ligase family protein [Nitrosomonadaceae bacterium]
MKKISEVLFYLWILSIPFYHFSLVGSLSLDNILGPLLIFIWPIAAPPAYPQYAQMQFRNIFVASIILFVYFIAHSVALLTTEQAVWASIYSILTNLSYFIVPLLYIRNEKVRKRAENCVVFIALMGAFSAFLSAVGVLQLDIARYSTSRIDVEGLDLERSIGLFSAFGDMALLSAFAVMTAMSKSRDDLLFCQRSRFVVIAIYLILVLGVLGTQSRNIVLTVTTSIILFMLVRQWSKYSNTWIPKFYALVIAGGLSMVITLIFLWGPIVELLAQWGGKQASSTAHERLDQYQLALELLGGNFLTGANPEIQERLMHVIGGIHNMWLKELVQGGMFAVLSIIALIAHGMRNATKCLGSNPDDESAITTLILMIALLVSTQFYPSGTSVFWMLLGFAVAKICAGTEIELKPVVERNQAESSGGDVLRKRKNSSFIPRRRG